MLYEYKQYRLSGILMLILNMPLSAIVFLMIWQNQGYDYPQTLIFAVGAYTFYTVITSVIDMIKYRKLNSPALSAAGAIRLAAALVSLLSFETAMLTQFGNDEKFRLFMMTISGTAVCVIVVGISIYMIGKAGKEIKKLSKADLVHEKPIRKVSQYFLQQEYRPWKPLRQCRQRMQPSIFYIPRYDISDISLPKQVVQSVMNRLKPNFIYAKFLCQQVPIDVVAQECIR